MKVPVLFLFMTLALVAAEAPKIEYSLDVSPVWAGHPVGFDMVTQAGRQYIAFYDQDRHMTVATRALNERKWHFKRLDSDVKWDSHNYIVMTIDADGYLHLSGNMHVVPLIYFRTTKPYDIDTFERVPSMVGSNEQRCTYPQFFNGPKGELLFTYRDGRSGSGDQIYNVYDLKTRTWKRLLDKPLTDGQGRMNAYFDKPALGPDGYYHLVWVWRNTPDCATNHDLSYARSKDMVNWETSAGKPLTLPIRVETAEVVDAVPPGGGIINGNNHIGFDSKKRPIIAYHKYDAKGNTQVYCARLEDGKWKQYPVTDWNYRWEFKGGGSIGFEVRVGAVQNGADGLTLDFGNPQVNGRFRLDEATLKATTRVTRAPAWPAEIGKLESDFAGMRPMVHMGRGEAGYVYKWETLGPNRDRPREGPVPAPSMLRVYKLATPVQRTTTVEGAYGRIETDKAMYRPLDTVKLKIEGRAKGDARCKVRVADSEQRVYFEGEVELKNNSGEARFTAAGPLGVHYVYLWFPGEKRYSRYVNFRLNAETAIETGDRDFDKIYPFTREAMWLGRREYNTPRGKFVGYISADTWHFDGIWLRDWIYQIPAYKYWEMDMSCGFDRFLEVQREDGQVPDGIERNGKTWRVGLESDVEYILVMGVWQTWQATGDDKWMAAAMPRLEKALGYIMSDVKHWDAANRLIKRQHSCDTWDYDIDGAADKGTSRHVIATCDQSGYALAFRAMSEMYRHLGKSADADRWGREADGYRQRAVKMLWDGVKFQHHVHLDTTISHGDFDERQQLAMGNTWAMTRRMATPDQSRSIIDEYRKRHKQTGDAYPWWSLQPGYPDRLGYWKDEYRKQGGYANGGLMPWVGGELCRAAFEFGREEYGVELMRQWADHLRRTGGAKVWYWPDGTGGFRTTNEVNYAGWGMAQWVDALVEGLAGVRDVAGQMRGVEVSPRWAAAGVRDARVTARYASSNAYFSYRMKTAEGGVEIAYSGSGTNPVLRVLLPKGFTPREATDAGKPVPFTIEQGYAVLKPAAKYSGAITLR